jgi:RsiW-degrading membrane proteinase PrsW (M82 family)
MEAGQRVASGDIANASALLPGVSRAVLVATYDSAFQSLLHILIAITVLSAFVMFAFLGKTGPQRAKEPSKRFDPTASPPPQRHTERMQAGRRQRE